MNRLFRLRRLSSLDRRYALAAALVVLISVSVRFAWILLVPNRQWSDVTLYDDAARQLARTGTLAYPYGDMLYRAWFPPGWPAFMAILYRVLGPIPDLFKPVNLILSGFTGYFTIRLGEKVFGRRAGLIGGLFLGLLPGWIVYVSLAQYEVFLTALLTAVLWITVTADWERAGSRDFRPHLVGVLLAWAVLTRPTLLLLPLLIAAYILGRNRRAWGVCAVVGLYVVGATAGWSARNYVVLGSPVFFSTNGGYNLWHGNNPGATGGAMHPPATTDPRLNPVVIRDELTFNREAYRYALEYIRQHPARFIRMIPRRLRHLYDTDTTGVYLAFLRSPMERPTLLERFRHGSPWPERIAFRAYQALMALALAGLVCAPWRSREVRLLAGMILYWTLFTAATFGQDRYRETIMPIFSLFAGYGVDRLWNRVAVLSADRRRDAAVGNPAVG